jgi:hypothetical protein
MATFMMVEVAAVLLLALTLWWASYRDAKLVAPKLAAAKGGSA